MTYDLLIKGGRVIDQAQGTDDRLDIGVSDGVIVDIARDLPAEGAGRIVNANGLVVSAGLIDFHAHAFIGSGNLGIQTDPVCRSTGVTTLVDAGSTGAANFQGFKEWMIDRAETRLPVFLHVSTIGQTDLDVGESVYLDHHDPERTAETALNHPGVIVGIKVRVQKEVVGENGLEPLRLAKKAASLAGGLPTMVHVTNPVEPLNRIVDLLEPGDIVTHFLHARGMGILGPDGKVMDCILEARRSGILFDLAHGRSHLNYDVARTALDSGLPPDTISSDLTRQGRAGTAKDLPHCMSKILALGMDLPSVLACATSKPAVILGMDDRIGVLKKGAVADIAVFDLETGDFSFEDCDGNVIDGRERLTPRCTIREGKVTWESGDEK